MDLNTRIFIFSTKGRWKFYKPAALAGTRDRSAKNFVFCVLVEVMGLEPTASTMP